MRALFVQVDEYELTKSFIKEEIEIKQKIDGEYIFFLTNKCISGIAKIIGKKIEKYQVEFIQIILEENRKTIVGDIRGYLHEEWGSLYLYHIAKNTAMSVDGTQKMMIEIEKLSNDLGFYLTNSDWLIEEAEMKIKKEENKRFEYEMPETMVEDEKERLHIKTQYILKKFGELVGCDVWIANNDKNVIYQGKPLNDNCLKKLPDYSLSEEMQKNISLIDTIWFDQNSIPKMVFEVEKSTSIYSGILRMSDLIKSIPYGNPKLFIVAPKEREEKVHKELRRPIFVENGINEICKFISIEDLCELYERVKDLKGCITEDILDKIAVQKGLIIR